MDIEKINRREALKKIGGFSILLFAPKPSLPGTYGNLPKDIRSFPEAETEVEDPEFAWSQVFEIVRELKESGFRSKYIDIDTLEDNVNTLKKGYTASLKWLNGLIIVYNQKELEHELDPGNPSKPSLIELNAEMLGKIDRAYIAPEDLITHNMEKEFLKYSFKSLKFFWVLW